MAHYTRNASSGHNKLIENWFNNLNGTDGIALPGMSTKITKPAAWLPLSLRLSLSFPCITKAAHRRICMLGGFGTGAASASFTTTALLTVSRKEKSTKHHDQLNIARKYFTRLVR